MIYLPFADDFRKVKFEEQPKGKKKRILKKFFVKLIYFLYLFKCIKHNLSLKKNILHIMALPNIINMPLNIPR